MTLSTVSCNEYSEKWICSCASQVCYHLYTNLLGQANKLACEFLHMFRLQIEEIILNPSQFIYILPLETFHSKAIILNKWALQSNRVTMINHISYYLRFIMCNWINQINMRTVTKKTSSSSKAIIYNYNE